MNDVLAKLTFPPILFTEDFKNEKNLCKCTMYIGLRFYTSLYLGFLIMHLRLIYIHIIGVFGGGGRGGVGPPLEKLISLAGQKRELGRTEMEAWQDRNGKLGGR